MTIRTGVRWKPSVYRSSQETINQGLDPSTTPPSGTIVRIAQCVAYDDTKVATGGNPYKPGSPATEVEIYILDESPRLLDLAAMDGKTQVQINAMWATALTDYKVFIQPAVAALVKSEIGVQLTPPSLF